jgi:hypothetical protein
LAPILCGVTKNLRIDCGFNIVPMWHLPRLAEDYAMADIKTGGQVIFDARIALRRRWSPGLPRWNALQERAEHDSPFTRRGQPPPILGIR